MIPEIQGGEKEKSQGIRWGGKTPEGKERTGYRVKREGGSGESSLGKIVKRKIVQTKKSYRRL